MGLYDNVTVEYELETLTGIPIGVDTRYQTKDFSDPYLALYKIDKNNQLWEEVYDISSIGKAIIEKHNVRWEERRDTKIINFYEYHKGRWIEFSAEIVRGKVKYIKCVADRFDNGLSAALWKLGQQDKINRWQMM